MLTGASSGIGRCAALHLAGRGARVALFARGEDKLRDLARVIEQQGGECLVVAGDVSREEDVDRLARAAVDRWGRIDTWVNNAAVFAQAKVEDLSADEYRRILEVGLLGAILGTARAIRQMRLQGRGVIIQVSSILGRRGAAYFGAYAAAKHGIDGLTESARVELWGTGIRLSTLYLPTLDTAIYQHGLGKMGTLPKPPPPVRQPEEAAAAIAELAESGDLSKSFGWFRYFYFGVPKLSPRLMDWFLHRAAGFTRTDRPAGPHNLHEPLPDGRIRGGWSDPGWKGLTLSETVRVLPLETLMGAAALGFLAGLLRGPRR